MIYLNYLDTTKQADTNSDGVIQRGEAVAAVTAFFNGNTSRATAVAVVVAYFSR